jgi:hypothetical protein
MNRNDPLVKGVPQNLHDRSLGPAWLEEVGIGGNPARSWRRQTQVSDDMATRRVPAQPCHPNRGQRRITHPSNRSTSGKICAKFSFPGHA